MLKFTLVLLLISASLLLATAKKKCPVQKEGECQTERGSACKQDPECCLESKLKCDVFNGTCCRTAGGECTAKHDCCSEACRGGKCFQQTGNKCTSETGAPCINDDECCLSATCYAGKCAAPPPDVTTTETPTPGPNCKQFGEACKYRSECCSYGCQTIKDGSAEKCCKNEVGDDCEDDFDCCEPLLCNDNKCSETWDGKSCVKILPKNDKSDRCKRLSDFKSTCCIPEGRTADQMSCYLGRCCVSYGSCTYNKSDTEQESTDCCYRCDVTNGCYSQLG